MPANADTDSHTLNYPNSYTYNHSYTDTNSHIHFHAQSDTDTEASANAKVSPHSGAASVRRRETTSD